MDNEFKTGKGEGLRYNKGKLRYDLVNPRAMEDFVQVLTDGSVKYKPRNWELGLSWTSVLASLKRHISAFEKGEDFDPYSGRLHIAHAACNIHFLNSFYYTFPQGDDRVKSLANVPKIGLDIDGVIADFISGWNHLHPEIPINPTSWYFDYNITTKFNQMIESGEIVDFYLNLPKLIEPKSIPFEPHCYITSRPVSSDITQKWLELNKFPLRPVYTVPVHTSKFEAAKDAGVEIFVDDSYANFVDLNSKGIFTYLYSASHNLKYNVGHMRINSLNKIPFFTMDGLYDEFKHIE